METIRLEPLQDREVSLFIQRILGKVADDNLVREVQYLTGGNPFFLIECLRAWKFNPFENGQLSLREECSPPESITMLVRDKIYGLEKESVAVLSAAAILGGAIYVDVIEEMTGITGEALVACMEELCREGFFRVNTEDRSALSYIFKHDIEREIVVERLGPAGRRHLHLRAAKALEKRRRKQPVFIHGIAHHYEAAGETQPAVKAWLEAGRYARSLCCRTRNHIRPKRGAAARSASIRPRRCDRARLCTQVAGEDKRLDGVASVGRAPHSPI